MAYTTIDDPEAYFQSALYTGTGSELAVTLAGDTDMQPDWVWLKGRSFADNHMVFDSVRGATKLISSDVNTVIKVLTSECIATMDPLDGVKVAPSPFK